MLRHDCLGSTTLASMICKKTSVLPESIVHESGESFHRNVFCENKFAVKNAQFVRNTCFKFIVYEIYNVKNSTLTTTSSCVKYLPSTISTMRVFSQEGTISNEAA